MLLVAAAKTESEHKSMSKTSAEVHLFITGGWDSTFMLCKLSRRSVTVKPIYVLNPKRKSHNKELAVAKTIIKAVRKHPNTKAEIKNLKIINLSDINVDQNVISARHRIMKKTGIIGYQYDYLATVAKGIGMVGLGIEKDLTNQEDGASAALKRLAKLKLGRYGWIVDQSVSDPDVNLIFGHIIFPIIDMTELEMVEWTKKYGYTEIMSLIWFCHSPIHGQPCGLCRPCEEKINSKMDFLLPEESIKRYLRAKKLKRLGDKPSRAIKNLFIFLLGDKSNSGK